MAPSEHLGRVASQGAVPPWRKDQNGLHGIDDVLCSKINFGALLYGKAPMPLWSYVLSTESVLPLQDVAWLQRYAVLSRNMLAFIHHSDDDRVIDYIPLAEIKEVRHSMAESRTCTARQSSRDQHAPCPCQLRALRRLVDLCFRSSLKKSKSTKKTFLPRPILRRTRKRERKRRKTTKRIRTRGTARLALGIFVCTLFCSFSLSPLVGER